jgi:signal peptidase I
MAAARGRPGDSPDNPTMTAPRFALPVPDPRDAPAAPPLVVVGGRERARRCAALAALGAAATAATLAVGTAVACFEADVVEVLARPASVADGLSAQGFRELAGLPGPSPVAITGLLPAVLLLLSAGVLRRLARGAPPMPGASLEALAAAERTMAWAVRVIAIGAILVFVAPALLELGGLRTISLTTGSMAPAHPAGSLLFVTRPADPAAIPVGAVAVIGGPEGSLVTHRVVAVVRDEAGAVSGYRTRGDAVASLDPEPVAPGGVVGVVAAGIPVAGALRAWMASPLGIAIALVMAWAFAGLGALLGDDARRAYPARKRGARGASSRLAQAPPTAAPEAVARSTSRPTA